MDKPTRCDANYSRGGYWSQCVNDATDSVHETSSRADVHFCTEHEADWNAGRELVVQA